MFMLAARGNAWGLWSPPLYGGILRDRACRGQKHPVWGQRWDVLGNTGWGSQGAAV